RFKHIRVAVWCSHRYGGVKIMLKRAHEGVGILSGYDERKFMERFRLEKCPHAVERSFCIPPGVKKKDRGLKLRYYVDGSGYVGNESCAVGILVEMRNEPAK